MVARIAAADMPNVETRVMNGHALQFDDGSFDAVFLLFGVIIFPDWRRGVAEIARVTRIGGTGAVASWQDLGAATLLLLGHIRSKLFPDREGMTIPDAFRALSNSAVSASELVLAGYRDPEIEYVTHGYPLDMNLLVEPDTLFGISD
jgi:SAM-dependent methyltransferase